LQGERHRASAQLLTETGVGNLGQRRPGWKPGSWKPGSDLRIRASLDLLKTETATQAKFGKISMRMRRKLAAWEDGYREAMLGIRLAHGG